MMVLCCVQLYKTVAEKMREMQKLSMSWIEVQFLRKAVDVLCQCRQTLMYTYVFAYYLRKNNQSIIFEVPPRCPCRQRHHHLSVVTREMSAFFRTAVK